MFQHTAARRRLVPELDTIYQRLKFQHTAARRRLVRFDIGTTRLLNVSTHSRPKAAGKKTEAALQRQQFQHTAARRRLDKVPVNKYPLI